MALSGKAVEKLLRSIFDEATGFAVLQFMLFGVISIFLLSLSAMTYYLFKSGAIRKKEREEAAS